MLLVGYVANPFWRLTGIRRFASDNPRGITQGMRVICGPGCRFSRGIARHRWSGNPTEGRAGPVCGPGQLSAAQVPLNPPSGKCHGTPVLRPFKLMRCGAWIFPGTLTWGTPPTLYSIEVVPLYLWPPGYHPVFGLVDQDGSGYGTCLIPVTTYKPLWLWTRGARSGPGWASWRAGG